ncbi:MAG: hypothetical protein EPO21_03905 [Chloroflexota bacterium]|nr:MAG: hypothetical protein EPO21_03905 [Chloroflexota bacterium]
MPLTTVTRKPARLTEKEDNSRTKHPDISPREVELLALLADKPLLNGNQIVALRTSSTSLTLRLLLHLESRGLLSCSVPAGRAHIPVNRYYHLSSDGIRVLARREGITPGRFAREHWLSPARLTMLFNSLEHTRGSHQFFVDLALEARKHDDQALLVWQGEVAATRRYLWHGESRLLRPDGYGVYRKHGRVLPFYLEWDSGNMGIKRHRRKLRTYHQCRSGQGARGWELGAGGPTPNPPTPRSAGFPAILAVTTDERVRQLNRAALQVARSRQDLVLSLFITTRRELEAVGTFGCHWWDVRSQRSVTLDDAPNVWIELNREKEA